MKKTVDVLILGGGPAGIQASRTIRMSRPDWRVAVIRKERASMVYCAIPYALEGLIDPASVLKKDELVTSVGAELINETAESVNVQEKWMKTVEGTRIDFEKLLFVPGSTNVIPPVPGHELNGILSVKTERDMENIQQRLGSGAETVVVIGAGAIGIEQALAYRKRGLAVHLVDLADRILPHMTDADMSNPLQEILVNNQIQLHLGSRLNAFHGNGRVDLVELSTGKEIKLNNPADFVIVSVGMRPLVDMVKDQLETGHDGILVNDQMQTSSPHVYAAGDVIQGWSGIDGNYIGGRLATNAVPMAKAAAHNIMGKNVRYPGFFNGAVTVVDKMRIGGTGFTETYAKAERGFDVAVGYGETMSRFPMMPDAQPVKVKLIGDRATGKIIGGQVIGQEAVAERIDVITLAIQQKMTASDLADMSYSAQPWQTFFPARNAIVQAAADLSEKLGKEAEIES
jgi:NADH oxidase (H2O2-forming)